MRVLRVILWVVPAAMAAAGIAFVLFARARFGGGAAWTWPAVAGIGALGLVGPAIAWLSLRLAIGTARAHVESEKQLARRGDQLSALNALYVAASESLDLDRTVATVLEQTMQTLDAAAGLVFLKSDDVPQLRLHAHRGVSAAMAEREARLQPGQCLCGEAVRERRPVFCADATEDARCTRDTCLGEGFRSLVCAPLEVNGQVIGLLQLASPQAGHFSDAQAEFVTAAARRVGVSIQNSRLHDTVRALSADLERKVNQRTSELEVARWALAEKARQLRRLLNESYRIQEDTRSRIAHDMHDGVTQIIIGALYETQAARQSLLDDPERAAASLERAQDLLGEVEREIRLVIYDLHPPVLDAMGLVVATRRFALTFAETFKIRCGVDVVGPSCRFPKETEIAVFRIIQAALHNVVSHAYATQSGVLFDFLGPRLRVCVEDDGIGFDPAAALTAPGDHLGLIGMKERAEALGAELVVDSCKGRGTRIELRLPPRQLPIEEER